MDTKPNIWTRDQTEMGRTTNRLTFEQSGMDRRTNRWRRVWVENMVDDDVEGVDRDSAGY